MNTSYTNSETAAEYNNFINSENGKIQQQTVWEAILKHLPKEAGAKILDAACGNGWLANKLETLGLKTEGFDSSSALINFARENNSGINFQVADLGSTLPYQTEQFNSVIFNMAAHDVAELSKAFSEISRVVKTGGNVLVTIANPYYSYPVGVWKRGILGHLLQWMPKLKLRPYSRLKNKNTRTFVWNEKFTSYFYTLPEYIDAASVSGLVLQSMEDLEQKTDSPKFNLGYQLYRYPIILLLVFKKTLK